MYFKPDYTFEYVEHDEVLVVEHTKEGNWGNYMPTHAFEVFHKQGVAVGLVFEEVHPK